MYNASIFYTDKRAEIRLYNTLKFDGFHHYSFGHHLNTVTSRKNNNVRSKKTVLNLINANFNTDKSIFLTLTFRENLQDLLLANRCFYSFIRKIRRINPKLEYLCTIEFQKRGAIHYHVILKNVHNVNYNCYIKKWRATIERSSIQDKGGSVRIEFLKNTNHLINYVSKYMTKKLANENLCGKKCYLISKGLKRPNFTRKMIDKKNDLNMLEETFPEIKGMQFVSKKTYTDAYTKEDIEYLTYINPNNLKRL